MRIARRNAAFAAGGGGLSAKSYVQDGLIYHLDAAENIGYGKFSDSTLTWVNLVGTGNDATIPSATPLTWSREGCDFKGRTYNTFISIPRAAFPATVKSVEWCGSITNTTVYARYIADEYTSGSSTSFFGLINNGGINTPGILAVVLGRGGHTYQANAPLNHPALGEKFTSGFSFSDVSNWFVFMNGKTSNQWTYNTITQPPTLDVGLCMPNKSPERTCDIVCCELRIYSRALTAEEIAANYAVDAARFNLTTA